MFAMVYFDKEINFASTCATLNVEYLRSTLYRKQELVEVLHRLLWQGARGADLGSEVVGLSAELTGQFSPIAPLYLRADPW